MNNRHFVCTYDCACSIHSCVSGEDYADKNVANKGEVKLKLQT